MQAYRWTAERVLRELNSAPGGLSRKQAAARLAKHGENRLARKKGDSLWRRFMLQLSDPMILVLLAAAAVSAVLCVVHREFPADVLIIMTVVTVNAVLGVVQESKAEKAIAALQEMTPATSRVLRGGAECTVPSRTLVPGDVVLLSAGDRIPADCRVLESIGGIRPYRRVPAGGKIRGPFAGRWAGAAALRLQQFGIYGCQCGVRPWACCGDCHRYGHANGTHCPRPEHRRTERHASAKEIDPAV